MLNAIFHNGPCPYFWCGKRNEDICAEMTNVPVEHWQSHPAQCSSLVTKDFNSRRAMLLATAALYMLFKITNLAFDCAAFVFREAIALCFTRSWPRTQALVPGQSIAPTPRG